MMYGIQFPNQKERVLYLPNGYIADKSIEKYKARFVARSFYKKEGINSEETLTPGSKVHFLQNYDGSKDKPSLMV